MRKIIKQLFNMDNATIDTVFYALIGAGALIEAWVLIWFLAIISGH